jgi:GxxExxY protein
MLNVSTRLTDAEEQIVSTTIGCGIEVHRQLGPGFKEPIYQTAFRLELNARGIRFEAERKIEVTLSFRNLRELRELRGHRGCERGP